MKNLKTLIKLHKHKVDNTLKEIAKFNASKDLMEKRCILLSDEMQVEISKFASTEYGFVLDNYLQNARASIDQLRNNIASLNQKILMLQEILHNQFSELKKFEIVYEKRKQHEKEILDAAEVRAIDEMNIMRYEYS